MVGNVGEQKMKYFRRSRIWGELLRKYPNEFDGWFTNGLGVVHFRDSWIDLSNRVRLSTLILRTSRVPTALGDSYPLLAFPDCFASGWRNEKGSRRRAPIQIDSELILRDVIVNKMFFRENPSLPRYEDNYYITNRALTWFIVFCHHDNWMLFAPEPDLIRVQEAWKKETNPNQRGHGTR